jgi:hypothetical protein
LVPDESLWILKNNQWTRWMKYRGIQREIGFVSEEQFFKRVEGWVNGTVNMTDDEGNNVLLEDTIDTECYTLVKSAYGKTITFRWDGLIMDAAFDGLNSRFWKNVKKLVKAEKLALYEGGRYVNPENALSKTIYQLARMDGKSKLHEVEIRRGEAAISIHDSQVDVMAEIRDEWGEGNWKIVDRVGIPFAATSLRDGTVYFAVKEGEIFQKQGHVRSFSHFMIIQVPDECRCAIEFEKKTVQTWLRYPSAWRIQNICESIWGQDSYYWNSEDLKDLHGRILHVKGRPAKPGFRTMIQFKVIGEDEPGKPQEMVVYSSCGTHITELSKSLQSMLWGRDFYLDTKGDDNVKASWAGKSFQVKWRCRGGMYKDDTWANSPIFLEDEGIPQETKIIVDVAHDSQWTKLSVNDIGAKEEIQEFIRNRFGLRAEAMVRHMPMAQAKILNGDVIVVTLGKREETSLVKIHIQWGDKRKNPLIQSSMSIDALRDLIERKSSRCIRRGQIPRLDDHVFLEDETIEIEDDSSLTLETEDLSFKVKLSGDSAEEILRKINNIWWPMPEEEKEILSSIRNFRSELVLSQGKSSEDFRSELWNGEMGKMELLSLGSQLG